MGKSSARQEVAEYRMSIQYGICQNEVDAIYLVEGDEKTIWSGRAESNQALIIDNVDLFGGIKKEGGVQGVIFVRLGGASQILTDFEAGKFGRTPATMSAFRGVCTLFFTEAENNVGVSGFYWRANQPFLPEIAVGVEYYPTSLQADYAKVPRFGTSSYPTETRDLIADGSLDGSGRRGASVSISDAINNGYGLIVHVWERYLGLLATAFFAFVSLNTLTQIAADQYSVTPQTIANWIAALILLSLLWAVLGRFEKYVDTVGRKSSIFTDFQKK